jgi:SAM-dependent methyltransferase
MFVVVQGYFFMSKNTLGVEIRTSDYVRERMEPHLSDFYYLALSDLKLELQKHAVDDVIDVLDYGCGGSPYRSLFPNARYKRADYLQAEGDTLDYILDDDSIVGEQNESFDLVLSTQVAEHVSSPSDYFNECFRLLRPGGRLICTTHGYFPDHGCPYDFQRWTADGLRRDLEKAGFAVERISKLTTGARAFFSMLDFSYSKLDLPKNRPAGLGVFGFRKFFAVFRPSIYRILDGARESERIVDASERNANLYIGLSAVSRKLDDRGAN